jgi:hypothetical protein
MPNFKLNAMHNLSGSNLMGIDRGLPFINCKSSEPSGPLYDTPTLSETVLLRVPSRGPQRPID